MNAVVKQKWVDSLRSGKYKQGTQCLKYDNYFCCLGVLCDLYIQEHPEVKWDDESASGNVFYGTGEFLPREVVDWAQLPSDNPKAENPYQTLSNINDNNRDADFLMIADIIEQQL